MSSAASPKFDPFYHAHFEVLGKKDDKSNRYWVRCKYCPGSKMIHRDSDLLKHITEISSCPNAPEHARMEGLRMLKRKLSGLEDKAKGVEDGPDLRKKRKASSFTLEAFLEKPITKESMNEYHRKLLQ